MNIALFCSAFFLLASLADRSEGAESVKLKLPAGSGNATRIEPPVRNNVWTVSVSGFRHNLKSADDNEIIGRAGSVSLGMGYIAKSWVTSGTLDFIMGPYEPSRSNEVDVDFSGTGATAWWGYSAQTLDLRSVDGGYGFALGISYSDTIGRAVGRNRQSPQNPYAAENEGRIDDYFIQVNSVSVIPALFFTWLAPARSRGNAPDLLTTRLEGWFLTIGAGMPIDASYKAKYSKRAKPDPESFSTGSERVKEKGKLTGYSILISLSGLLGT